MDFSNVDISLQCIKKMPKDYAAAYILLPVKEDNRFVHIVSSEELNTIVKKDINFFYNKEIKLYKASMEEIKYWQEFYYNQLEFKSSMSRHTYERQYSSDFYDSISNSPVVKITDFLIKSAVEQGASDIHFEPQENNVIVRYRVDGRLFKFTQLSNDIYNAVGARIKITSGMDISKKYIPQDGKMTSNIQGIKYDLRISSIPVIHGEKFVIRILKNEGENISFKALGFADDSILSIKRILAKKRGLVLVCGPTGSGKTTTLYAMLKDVNKYKNNIVTIEDPVEYRISYINQINVNNKSGLTFENGLRSILRQDPDIIMVGEIRDEETAQIAVKAAISGHLILSTIHTYDSIGAFIRLCNMNVPTYYAADALTAIISQRLVEKVCTNCGKKRKLTENQAEILDIKDNCEVLVGTGCKECNYTGYRGRTVVYEILEVNDELRDKMKQYEKKSEIKEYVYSNGFKSLYHRYKKLLLKGIVGYEKLHELVEFRNE